MEIIKQISLQPIPNLKPKRWRVLVETGLFAANGSAIKKHVGDLIEETPTCFKCIFLIRNTRVTTEEHKNHTQAIKAFREWVEALGIYQPKNKM